MHQPAAAAVGLDADAVVRAVDGEVVDQHVIHAAIGSAADRHAMAGIEMIVQNGNIRRRPRFAGLDRNVVVAGVDGAIGDGHIARRAGIDAVGVARRLRRHDLHAPCGESIRLVHARHESRASCAA